MLPLQKEELKKLLQAGNRIEAVKYARDTFNVSLKDAVRLVNTVDQEMNPGKKIKIDSFTQDSGIPKIAFYVFGGLGILFMGIAVVLFYFDQRAVHTFTKTTGVVVANRLDQDADGSTYAPDVTFQWEGKELMYRSSTYSNPPSFQIGEQVDLYVNPSNPYDVVIDSFSQRFVVIIVFDVLGITFLGVLGLTNKFMK